MFLPSPIQRHAGGLSLPARVAIAIVAMLPLLVVVLCSVPALVLWPFIPVTRAETARRIEHLIEWTRVVLDAALAGADSATAGDVPRRSPRRPRSSPADRRPSSGRPSAKRRASA
ncbi:MAG: hypothetical protein AUI14_25275 [Actinobacteria bacterium 13_2_20CM_2_71_6]|nr:MAG: hypothetical protein AUI14_25275 [Actinobacteria bacterium 13_2_20CM_2_71_6]